MATAQIISSFLDQQLKVSCISDRSINGLQIESSVMVHKIGFAVDACMESFELAVKTGCQMLVVHHGLVWGGIKAVCGSTYSRLAYSIKNQLALYASHLPLDLHPEYGNNIQLARLLCLSEIEHFGKYEGIDIGFMGKTSTSLGEIKKILAKSGIKTDCLAFGKTEISTIAVVSGGACDVLPQAIAQKVDLFITGEPVHQAYQEAKENGINVIFGGHYETEVWGVKALMPLLQEQFKVAVEFLDISHL